MGEFSLIRHAPKGACGLSRSPLAAALTYYSHSQLIAYLISLNILAGCRILVKVESRK
ncbi:hypothetical protein ARNL5_02271 [Anaerolineae bacterium]|nr:hypothetical protein ARNL5_02271 [Anaerolineae bacterium]